MVEIPSKVHCNNISTHQRSDALTSSPICSHPLWFLLKNQPKCAPPPSQTEKPKALPNKHTHTCNNDWLATDKAAVKRSLVAGMNTDSQTPRQTLVRTTHTTHNTNSEIIVAGSGPVAQTEASSSAPTFDPSRRFLNNKDKARCLQHVHLQQSPALIFHLQTFKSLFTETQFTVMLGAGHTSRYSPPPL